MFEKSIIRYVFCPWNESRFSVDQSTYRSMFYENLRSSLFVNELMRGQLVYLNNLYAMPGTDSVVHMITVNSRSIQVSNL